MTKNKIDMEELKVKVVEVSQEKIAVWTTESNINALCFDIDRKI